MDNFIVTTCPSVEGYKIVKHLGPVFGEVVYKASFLKSLGSAFEDFGNALSFSEREMSGVMGKLENARNYAMNKIQSETRRLGGNAIIGLDVESSNGGDIMHISMVGTAVKIEKDQEELTNPDIVFSSILFDETNYNDVFIIYKLNEIGNNKAKVLISANIPIKAIKFHIEAISVFDEKIVSDSIELISFRKQTNYVFESNIVEAPNNLINIKNAKHIIVIVEKYVVDEDVITVDDTDLKKIDKQGFIDIKVQNTISEIAVDNSKARVFFLSPDIGETAADLYSALLEQIEDKDDPACRYILRRLERIVSLEKRFSTNKKEDFLKMLEQYFEKYCLYLSNKDPIKVNDHIIKCPLCGTEQRGDRTVCSECGIKFYTEE